MILLNINISCSSKKRVIAVTVNTAPLIKYIVEICCLGWLAGYLEINADLLRSLLDSTKVATGVCGFHIVTNKIIMLMKI
mmetsp:Transcript_42589/g.69256  ORF Transcript_42589/g.69256 Transcript_42589/m.69256 type:complete len:80 (+) Transcript_42589:1786-2025(+)